MKHDLVLQKRLGARESRNALRKLEVPEGLVDFCSNDYLGFARSEELASTIDLFEVDGLVNKVGSGASRLISANNSLVENLEQKIASFVRADSALLFNSGYNSNLGFFSSVPQRSDAVFYDELIHASIRDGIQMGVAKSYSFKHNDLNDLQKKLSTVEPGGSVFVVVESVYSMDGDSPDLVSFANFCDQHQYHLVVDEAHAFGVFGDQGQGLVCELGIEQKVYARILTFGKALGCHGAMVVGSETLRTYLVNFARSLIYTTMMSINDQKAIFCAVDRLSSVDFKDLKSMYLSSLFREKVEVLGLDVISSSSTIQSLVFQGNDLVKTVEQELRENGFWVKAILSPTVPVGRERIRVCFHEYNTEEQVHDLVKCLRNV